MKLNKDGYELICKFEGLMLKPYLCSAKVPTIGYGNTYYPNGKKVTLLDGPITKDYALEIFKIIADKYALRVSKLIISEINQNQFNSLVSFAYNVGVASFQKSTLLKKVNANPNDKTIANEFKKWCRAGGIVVQGLINRRELEIRNYDKK